MYGGCRLLPGTCSEVFEHNKSTSAYFTYFIYFYLFIYVEIKSAGNIEKSVGDSIN